MSEHHHKHHHNHTDEHNHPENGALRNVHNVHIAKNEHGKKKVRLKAKNTPGVIRIERHIHDDAVVISGSLTVDFINDDLYMFIEQELEAAAREITDSEGVVGHIKAALSVSSTSMISVTDSKAMTKESPYQRAQITLAAIVFLVDPEIAEGILRKALAAVKSRLRNNDNTG